jgi:hypothetical protein
MANFGDSHTGFNDTPLLGIGLGGGAAIGSAVVTGVMNHLADARARRQTAWNEQTWQRALQLSEMLTKRALDRAVRAEADAARLRATVARLSGGATLATARAMRAG